MSTSTLTGSQVVEANSLGLAWIQCLQRVLEHGEWVTDDAERLLELRNLMVCIKSVDAAGDDIVGRYADEKRIALMYEKYRSCGIVAHYRISYGARLYAFHGVNQIEWVIARLRSKPETKSATVGMHDPGEDHLSCLSLLDFKLRGGRIDMLAVYRSQNVFGSQPGNVLALREVQEHVGRGVGALCGSLSLVVASAHIYECDISSAEAILGELQGTS